MKNIVVGARFQVEDSGSYLQPVTFTVAEVLFHGRYGGQDNAPGGELAIILTARDKYVVYRTEGPSCDWFVYDDVQAAAAGLVRDEGGPLGRRALRELGWWDFVAREA